MTEERLNMEWRIARSVAIKLVFGNMELFAKMFGEDTDIKNLFTTADEIAEYIVKGRKE